MSTSALLLMQTSQRPERGISKSHLPAIRLIPGNESLLELQVAADGLGLHPSGD